MKTKITYSVIMLVVSLGLFLGFNVSDNPKNKVESPQSQTINPVHPVPFGTVVYVDSLNGANDTVSLKNRGYKVFNRCANGPGTAPVWNSGIATAPGPAFNGPATGYALSTFNMTTGTSNQDGWLVLPRLAGGINATDSLYFYARNNSAVNVDSIRVMYSTNDSVPEGTWIELGRFLCNATTWTRVGFKASSTSVNGRFAIRSNTVGGGPTGPNCFNVGIDMITIERVAAPPPLPTTWYEQVTGVTADLYTISAADINNVWAAGTTGKVVRTTNGGTWTNVSGNLPAGDIFYACWAFDANTCLVTSSPGATFTYKTTNGGTNWVQVFTQAGGFIDGFYFKDANNGLMLGDAVGGRSSNWKTTNGGTTWDSAGVNFASTEGFYNNSIAGVGDVVYIGGGNTKIFKTTNFGTTWAPTVAAPGEANIASVYFNDANNGLFGGNTLVQLTTNGGTTWTSVTPPGTAGQTVGIAGTAPSNYWAARTGTVYATTNAGTNWTTSYTAAGTFRHMVKARTGSPYLYACRSNGTVAKYGGLFTGVTPGSNGVVSNYALNQNYPNPFNPTTKITFAVPVSGLVNLKVYDMTGKEIATLVNGQLNNGNYSVDFNAASLSSGIYFYTIKSGNFTDTKKMMLIK